MPYKYDLALSFAGTERELANRLATRLDAAGYSIFFDEFFQAKLWGQDLSISLADVYARDARYCLILLSAEYIERTWTTHERRHAMSRFISERGEYILCLKIDEIELPGFPTSVSYVSLDRFAEDEVYKFLLEKLGSPNHEGQLTTLPAEDVELVLRIIEACFRRAIYTRMDSEISMQAMIDSIGHAIGERQRIQPSIRDQHLQWVCLQMIAALDAIQRIAHFSRSEYSNNVSPDDRRQIDSHKLQVVRYLLEIRRAAKIPMQLPFALRLDHFFKLYEADAKPQPIGA